MFREHLTTTKKFNVFGIKIVDLHLNWCTNILGDHISKTRIIPWE